MSEDETIEVLVIVHQGYDVAHARIIRSGAIWLVDWADEDAVAEQ